MIVQYLHIFWRIFAFFLQVYRFTGPRVSQSSGKNCKNSQKLYKNCSCIKIPQFITLTSILGHLGSWWGPWGVKIEILQWPGVILEIGHRSFSIFALFLYVEHHCDTGILNFWLWSFIVPPYLRWRYSTVIHWEQLVYLAVWKDLNKENKDEPKDKIKLMQWGGWSSCCFFLRPSSRLRRSGRAYVLLLCVCIADDMQNPSNNPS